MSVHSGGPGPPSASQGPARPAATPLTPTSVPFPPTKSIRDGASAPGPDDLDKMDDTFYELLSIHLDQPVGSMSISPANRDVALGARKGLFIVDLQNPYDPPRFLPYHSSWEVADVQWNPFPSRSEWVVSTSNQKAVVYNLSFSPSLSVSPIEHTLHAHTRAVTDINWSPSSPEILATCALDGWVWSWDLRTGYGSKSGAGGARKPVWGVCSWGSGATQVKWNRKEPHVIASSHDNHVLIWDDRMGAVPVTKIQGHSAKIYGIDWSREDPDKIVTCSLDKSFKSWSIKDTSSPDLTVLTSSPVWRARYLPFGRGVLTLPQRSDHALSIWGREKIEQSETAQPVARFLGATAGVKEFVWRTRGGDDLAHDDREFQLVTWAKDRRLRLWPISDEILKGVGHVKGGPITIPVTRRGGRDVSYRSFAETPAPPHQPLAFPTAPLLPRHLAPTTSSLLTTSLPPVPVGPSLLTSSLLSAGFAAGSPSFSSFPRLPPDLIRGAATMTTTSVRNRRQKAHDRLAWMEGVKIEKSGAAMGHIYSTRVSTDAGSKAETRASSVQRGTDGGTAREGGETERAESVLSFGSKATEMPVGKDQVHANLGEEITSVVRRFPRVNFEKVHIAGRTCTVSMYCPSFVRATFTFPKTYPLSAPPSIDIERTADISSQSRAFLLQSIRKLMAVRSLRGVPSFELALRFLLGDRSELDTKPLDDDEGDDVDDDEERVDVLAGLSLGPGGLSADILRNNLDTPPPRRGGAVFGPLGQLVVFFPGNAFANVLPEREDSMTSSVLLTSPRGRFPPRISEAFGNLQTGLARDSNLDDDYHETDEALQIPGGHSFPSLVIASRPVAASVVPPAPTFSSTVRVVDLSSLTLTSRPSKTPLLSLSEPPLATAQAALAAAIASRNVFLSQIWSTLVCFFDKGEGTASQELPRNLEGLAAERILAELLTYLVHLRDIQTMGTIACLLEMYRRSTQVLPEKDAPPSSRSSSTPFGQASRNPSVDYFSHRIPVASTATTPYDVRTPLASRTPTSKSSWTNLATGLFSSSVLSLRSGPSSAPTSPQGGFQSGYPTPTLRSPPVRVDGKPMVDSPDSVRSSMARLGGRNKSSPAMGVTFGETRVSLIAKEAAPKEEPVGGSKKRKVVVTFSEDEQGERPWRSVPWWLTARAQLELELVRLAYADVLESWGCHHERINVLKLCRSSTLLVAGVSNYGAVLIRAGSGFDARSSLQVVRCCPFCGSHLTGPSCFTCRRRPRPLTCGLCHLPLTDLTESCTVCMHAGHLTCYQEWFSDADAVCPTGCGCFCSQVGGLSGVFVAAAPVPPPPKQDVLAVEPSRLRARPAERFRSSLPFFAI